jgi:hypothetical protein
MDWTVRGSKPGAGETFRARPGRPWGPSSLLYIGYRVFPGGKAVKAWRWPPTPSSAEVKERVGLDLYSTSAFPWPVLRRTLPLSLHYYAMMQDIYRKSDYSVPPLTVWVGRVAQSVQRLATSWTVRGSNPGGAIFFAHVQTGPGAHPASRTMDTGSFPGGKRPGRGADHPPTLAPRSIKSRAIPLLLV